jgi:hypothetical protein
MPTSMPSNTKMEFMVRFLGVPPRFARGRAATGFARAPSRLWRDRPFGAPSASLTQGGGACAAAHETYPNYDSAFGIRLEAIELMIH